MDALWDIWLYNLQSQGCDADRILQQSLFGNSLHNTGITDVTPRAVTTYWHGLDSHSNYQHNISSADRRQQLAEQGWLDFEITYDLNSWGFRSPGSVEFNTITEPSLVTIGCSFTFGTGLHQSHLWGQLAADQLSWRLINLGTPGHGLDMNTQWLLTHGHTLLNPRAVVILQPPPGRLTWYEETADHSFIGNTYSMNKFERHEDIIKNLKYNAFMHYVKNYHSIRVWCKAHAVPFYFIDTANVDGDITQYGLARDLAHTGRGWHRKIAERVVHMIKDSQ